MNCYKAENIDIGKIANFMNAQTNETLTDGCIEFALRRVQETKITEEALKKMISNRQGYEMFICEDELGNIRHVIGRERRGKEFREAEPEASAHLEGIMHDIDLQQNIQHFRTGLWEFIAKHDYDNYGTKKCFSLLRQEHLSVVEGFFGKEFVTIRKTWTIPDNEFCSARNVYNIEIDLEGWLKKIKYI